MLSGLNKINHNVTQYSVDFLGNSQTFLGVLATIIILFIISNNSNLIREILKEVKEKIAKSVENLQVNTDLSNITNTSEYKLISWFQKAGDGDEKLLDEASKWTAIVNSKRQELQSKYMDVELKDPEILKKIEESKEQSLAPLFSFIFCLILFVFDELLKAYSIKCNDFLLTFLSLYIVVSYVFWIMVWMNFIFYMRHDIRKIKNTHIRVSWIESIIRYGQLFREWYLNRHIFNKMGKPREGVLMFLRSFLIIVLVGLLLVMHRMLIPINTILIVAFGIVIPIAIIGVIRLWAYVCENKFTFVFLCGHVLTIGAISFLLALVFIFGSEWLDIYDNIILQYSKPWMKVTAFTFVGLNGIVLPLLLPYYCYNQYYHMAEKKVKDSKKDEEKEVDELMSGIKEFAAKLPGTGEQ